MNVRMTCLITAVSLLATLATAHANTMEVTRVLLPESIPSSELLNQPFMEEMPILAVYTAYHYDRGIFLVEDWMSTDDMLDELRRSHRKFLVNMVDMLEVAEEKSDGTSVESSLPDLQWQLDYLNETDEVLVAGVVVDLSLATTRKMFRRFPFSVQLEEGSDNLVEMPLPNYVSATHEDAAAKRLAEEINNSPPSLDSHSGRGWTPYSGSTSVSRDVTQNILRFSDISGFYDVSTYEHEVIINNRGYAKDGSHFSSDLPRWYKDCTASWPWDKVDKFVIGSLRAYDISTLRNYNMSYELKPDDSRVTSSTGQVNGQRGHRVPSGWYSCFAVNADDTCQLTQTFTAPTVFSWSRGATCLD